VAQRLHRDPLNEILADARADQILAHPQRHPSKKVSRDTDRDFIMNSEQRSLTYYRSIIRARSIPTSSAERSRSPGLATQTASCGGMRGFRSSRGAIC